MRLKIAQLVFCIFGLILCGDIYRFLTFHPAGNLKTNVQIARGTPVSTIANNLSEKNYISNSFYYHQPYQFRLTYI